MLACIKFTMSFDKISLSIRGPLSILSEATSLLKKCSQIPKILEIILAIGDFVNTSNSRLANFFAFQIEFLTKLKKIKLNNNKTFIEYLVGFFSKRHTNLLHWYDDLLHPLKAASELNTEQLETDIVDIQKQYENHHAKAETIACSPKDPFALVKTKLEGIDSDLIELNQLKNKSFQEWKVLAEGYGVDLKTVKPENFFAIFATFAEDFKERVLALEEEEKKKKEKDEKLEDIALKRATLERRKAELLNRRTVNTAANSSFQKRPVSLPPGVPSVQIAKQREQKDEEVMTQISNMVSNLVTGKIKGRLRRTISISDRQETVAVSSVTKSPLEPLPPVPTISLLSKSIKIK